MALFIAKRRKEFNEGPLLILSIDGAATTTVVSPLCAGSPQCWRRRWLGTSMRAPAGLQRRAHTRRATRAPHSRAPQRHTPASWLSEARRNSVKKSERQRRCRWLRRERVKRFQVQLQASKRMPAPLGGLARRVAWRAAVAQAEHAVHEQCIQSTLSRP